MTTPLTEETITSHFALASLSNWQKVVDLEKQLKRANEQNRQLKTILVESLQYQLEGAMKDRRIQEDIHKARLEDLRLHIDNINRRVDGALTRTASDSGGGDE